MTEAEIEAEIEAVARAICRAASLVWNATSDHLRRICLRDARAAIAALDMARGDGWRTMDSAPTDGQAFLAVVCGQVRVVAYTKTSHVVAYTKNSHVPITGFCIADQGPEDFDICNPTCWRPLPTPPTTEGA